MLKSKAPLLSGIEENPEKIGSRTRYRDAKMEDLPKHFKQNSNNLFKWNRAAFFAHAAYFVVLVILAAIYSDGSLKVETTTDFRIYDGAALGPPEAGPFSTTLKSLGFTTLIWIQLAFPFITAFFHFILAYVPSIRKRYSYLALVEGRNPYRWGEYSVSASFMTLTILWVSGVTNLFVLLITGVVCNVALQAMGSFMEQLNPPNKSKRKGGVNWEPTIVGWVIFVGQWAVIFTYFFKAVTSDRPPGTNGPPWFVYTIVIGLFFQFALFGIIQLLHYLRWPWFLASAYQIERGFIILSFVAKITLSLVLDIGIITNQMSV